MNCHAPVIFPMSRNESCGRNGKLGRQNWDDLLCLASNLFFFYFYSFDSM